MTTESTFAPPPPAPLGLGGIMSTALGMYRARPWALLVLALISTLPIVLLSTGGDLAYGVPTDNTARILRGLIVTVPSLLLGQISAAGSTVLAMDLLNRRPATASHALEVVGLRFWPLMAVIAVMYLGILAGGVLLVIPAIVAAIYWLYAPIVSVVEGRGMRASFRRSVALTRGAFWWTLGAFLAIQLTVALASVVAAAVLSAPFGGLGGDARIVADGIVSLLVQTAAQPVALVGVGLMYLERRVTREGMWPSPGSQPPM